MYSNNRGVSPLRHWRLLSTRENIELNGRQRNTQPQGRQRERFAFAVPFV
jgi:hypothetical protein